MGLPDDAAEARAQGWRTLAAALVPELAPLVGALDRLTMKV